DMSEVGQARIVRDLSLAHQTFKVQGQCHEPGKAWQPIPASNASNGRAELGPMVFRNQDAFDGQLFHGLRVFPVDTEVFMMIDTLPSRPSYSTRSIQCLKCSACSGKAKDSHSDGSLIEEPSRSLEPAFRISSMTNSSMAGAESDLDGQACRPRLAALRQT